MFIFLSDSYFQYGPVQLDTWSVVNKRACESLHSPTDFPSGGHPRVQFTISRITFCPGRGMSIAVTPADPGEPSDHWKGFAVKITWCPDLNVGSEPGHMAGREVSESQGMNSRSLYQAGSCESLLTPPGTRHLLLAAMQRLLIWVWG